ncbi:MAG: replication initiator protein [Arizlama microvirus]|nr:MAG: replication initiator protein [Arizlama microvirus]
MCSAPWVHPAHGPTKCGQCMECRLAYSREWAIRMSHESRMHTASCFLTLTYDDAHLPRFGQLHKSHLQDFFKRLRYHVGPFRYVACGEYGELKRRPHFHVALFGMDFRSDRVPCGEGIKGDTLYCSPTLARIWGHGELLRQCIGSLTFESAAYIARYVTKKVSGPNASPLPLACDPDTGELVMPNPEFLLCSRKPAIGDAWFRKYGLRDVLAHGRVITDQGTPAPIPRYYKNLIKVPHMRFAKLQFDLEQMTTARMYENTERSRFEDSPERRAARSVYANARVTAFARDVKE